MRRFFTTLCAVALSLAWAGPGRADLFSTTFTGSKLVNVDGNSLSLAASAEFLLNTGVSVDTLTLVLSNTSTQQYTSGHKAVPSALLTGVFFDVQNNPALTYVSATASSVIQKDTGYSNVAIFSGSHPTGTQGGWEFLSKSSGLHDLSQDYGVGTAGFDIFHGNLTGGYPSSPHGNQQYPFGIINSNYTALSKSNITGVPLVQDQITFVFTLTHGLLTSDIAQQISNLRFQYGTDLEEPHFNGTNGGGPTPPRAVPEPSTLAIAGLGVLGLLGYGLRRRAG